MATALHGGFTSYCTERNYEQPGDIVRYQKFLTAMIFYLEKRPVKKNKWQNGFKSTISGTHIKINTNTINTINTNAIDSA